MPIRLLMWKFLESEMKVIHGLTQDASMTDAQIADMYGLRKGTVATIRRRLTDAGALFYVNVPAFNKLGCELIGFDEGLLEPSERMDVRTNEYIEFCNRSPRIFQGIIGGTSVVLFTAFRNITEYEFFLQSHNKFFSGSKRPLKARLHGTQFPFSVSRGTFIPNFATIVHGYFKLDVPPPKPRPPVSVEVTEPDFTEAEKRSLVAMVENPMASDREIADIGKLSRQAVTRIRNRFSEESILTKVCIPRLYKWGFEICVVAHALFSMDMAWDKRLKTQPRQVMDGSFYTLSKPDESVATYLIPKYSGFTENLDNTLAWYHKSAAFDEKPTITMFPLERTVELRNFDYGPAVRSLLLKPAGKGKL